MDDELAPIRGEIRSPGFRRVSHGLFLPLSPGLDSREEWRRELSAWRLVLPADAAFTHITAAALYDWWLPQLPEFVPVFAATRLDDNRPRRAGLSCSRLDQPSQGQVRYGLPVDSPHEVLLRAARDLGLLDLVVLVDAALHLGDVSPESLADFCRSSRPGVRRLRVAVGLADGRSESAWETALRLFHRVRGRRRDAPGGAVRRGRQLRGAGRPARHRHGTSPTSTTAPCTTSVPDVPRTCAGSDGSRTSGCPPRLHGPRSRRPPAGDPARARPRAGPPPPPRLGFGAGRDGWRSPASPSPDAADCRTGG